MGGNQSVSQTVDNHVQSLISVLNNQANQCAASSAQIASIRIVNSRDVNVNIEAIRQAANVVAECAQNISANASLQSGIDSSIAQTAKQVKEFLNLNPGSQSINNVIKSAILVDNSLASTMLNVCVPSAQQLISLDIIGSQNVNTAIGLIEQISKVAAQCAQSSALTASITNTIKQDFSQESEQKSEFLPWWIIIVVIVIAGVMLLGSAAGGAKYIIPIGILVLAGLAIYWYVSLRQQSSDGKTPAQRIEERTTATNQRYDQWATQAIAACDASRAAGYKPQEGFYWSFIGGNQPGPYVPPATEVRNGAPVPRLRTGEAEGRPAGFQGSVVRINAERLAVDYYDGETDQDICTRISGARPNLVTRANAILHPENVPV